MGKKKKSLSSAGDDATLATPFFFFLEKSTRQPQKENLSPVYYSIGFVGKKINIYI